MCFLLDKLLYNTAVFHSRSGWASHGEEIVGNPKFSELHCEKNDQKYHVEYNPVMACCSAGQKVPLQYLHRAPLQNSLHW